MNFSVIFFVSEARSQFFVAETLTNHVVEADILFIRTATTNKRDNINELAQKGLALFNARAFHYGMAIENATKTQHIFDGRVTSVNGLPKGLRTDHDILEHVRQCKVNLNDEEQYFLERLSFKFQVCLNTLLRKMWNPKINFLE